MLFTSIAVFAQQRTITGKVINKNTREPLSGVTVQAKNKTTLNHDTSGQIFNTGSIRGSFKLVVCGHECNVSTCYQLLTGDKHRDDRGVSDP